MSKPVPTSQLLQAVQDARQEYGEARRTITERGYRSLYEPGAYEWYAKRNEADKRLRKAQAAYTRRIQWLARVEDKAGLLDEQGLPRRAAALRRRAARLRAE